MEDDESQTPRDELDDAMTGDGSMQDAEMELWDEDRRLLAYGTQTMMLRSLPGERVTSGR